MKTLEIFVAGIPKAQPRVKACRRGAFSGVYDPGTANDWKQSIRCEVLNSHDGVKFSGPLNVDIIFNIPRPKSHIAKNGGVKEKAPFYVTKKPDIDNFIKAVFDAINNIGTVWDDDSQVASVTSTKRYGAIPGAKIKISEIE